MANDPRKRGQQAWRSGAGNNGGGGGAARGPNYKWKPEDERPPGTGGRYLKIILLSLGLIAVVSAFVYWVIKPKATPQATLVGIATNPADDAEFLNVPLDPYGWQTAQQVTELGKEFAKQGHDRTSPDLHPLPADPTQLPAWADKLKDEQFDPLVLYVGLPCGTDRNGEPILFTGGRDASKKANQLQVRKLLETLRSDPLTGKKKVLILDAGRIPVDPVYGLLHDDFAARMKGLSNEIMRDPNLVVLVGVSPGQRGWESEEHRTTAFGRSVLRALKGHDIASDGTEQISAKQLFDSVKKQTSKWAIDNRPTDQEPFLLPEGATELAGKIIVGVRPASPPSDAAAPGAAALSDVISAWKQHDQLAKASPHPAAYSPRAWRRYRELLLRYEMCARSGEPKSTAALKGAVADAYKAVPPPDLLSKGYSAALTVALGGSDPVAEQLATLRDPASFAADLETAVKAFQARFSVNAPRPPEAHLPIMVREFYTTVVQPVEAVPVEWAAAITLHTQAERAAFGLAATDKSSPYVERLWPVVEPRVNAGDKLRRAIEDGLFSKDFTKPVKAAQDEYENATKDAAIVRAAHQVRDEACADLPYLARSVWFVKTPAPRLTADAESIKFLRQLWADVHALTKSLDSANPNVAAIEASTKKIAKGLADLREDHKKQIEERKQSTADTQGEWFAKQQLLASPLISAEDRERLLNHSRKASKALNDETVPRGMAASPAQPVDPKDAVVIRGRLAKAALGSNLPGVTVDDVLRDLDKLTLESSEWYKRVAETGYNLSEQFLNLSMHRLPPSEKANTNDERLSRSAIPFDADPPSFIDPALANRRLRWRTLLYGLADRVATDHWYDESPIADKYYARAANAFLADANTVTAGLPPLAPPAELTAKLDLTPLPPGGTTKVTWTSQLSRRFEFTFPPTATGYPQGTATGVWRLGRCEPIKPQGAAPSPTPIPLPLVESKTLVTDLHLAATHTSVPADRGVEFALYFRGQRPTPKTDIRLNREPYLVMSDPAPQLSRSPDEVQASFAVRAAKGLPFGDVAILIDYSGSMKESLNGSEVSAYKTNPESKFYQTQLALRKVLQALPHGTPLRIRVFSDKEQPGGNRLVFPDSGEEPKVTWEEGNETRLERLARKLNDLEPWGLTPLAASIQDAARDDLPRRQDSSRTLIVLTDGADQTGDKETTGDALTKLRDQLYDKFSAEDITLHVVRIGLNPAQKKNSDELLKRIADDGIKSPGAVWTVDKINDFERQLLDAIRPKLKVEQTGAGFPEAIGKIGWPSRPLAGAKQDDRQALYWSPLITGRTARGPAKYTGNPTHTKKGRAADLQLGAGDRMLLDLVPTDDGSVVVKRGLYTNYLREKGANLVAVREDGEWVAAVPGNAIDNDSSVPRYRTTVFLERVYKDSETVLQLVRPELPNGFLWWEVLPPDGKPLGTVRVVKRYGEAAPAYEVWAKNWKVGDDSPRAQINVWIAPAEAVQGKKVELLPKPTSDWGSQTVLLDGEPLDVRVSFETHPLVPKEKDKLDEVEVPCLVVRITHPLGKPVLARLDGQSGHHTKHSFYEPSEYTALFGPFTPTSFGAGGKVTLELYPVTPGRQDKYRITLTPPKPGTGMPSSLDTPKPSPARNAPAK